LILSFKAKIIPRRRKGSQLLHHLMFGLFRLQNVSEFGAGREKTMLSHKKKGRKNGDMYSIPRSISGMAVSMPEDSVTLDSSIFFSGALKKERERKKTHKPNRTLRISSQPNVP